jgi:hypothetical protein
VTIVLVIGQEDFKVTPELRNEGRPHVPLDVDPRTETPTPDLAQNLEPLTVGPRKFSTLPDRPERPEDRSIPQELQVLNRPVSEPVQADFQEVDPGLISTHKPLKLADGPGR